MHRRRCVTAAAMLALCGCLDPTQITLTLTTDVDCDVVDGTSLTFGPLAQLEQEAPATETTACQPAGGTTEATIGSIVAVPSGDDDSDVAFKVVTSVSGSLDACVPPDYAPNCIIARRALGFIPDKSLNLPIVMRGRCLGVICKPGETCVKGECRPARVDPEQCVGDSGCDEELLAPGQNAPPPDNLRITDSSAADREPSLTWNGQQYGLVWLDDSDGTFDVFFLTLDKQGVAQSSPLRATTLAGNAQTPMLAVVSGQYRLSYYDGSEIHLEPRTFDGAGLHPAVVLAGLASAVSSNDLDAVHAWSAADGVHAARIKDGVWGPGVLLVPTDQVFGPLSVAGGPKNHALLWTENNGVSTDLYLGIRGVQPGVAPIKISVEAGSASPRSLVWTPNGVAIGWAEARSGRSRIYFRQFSAQGVAYGPEVAVSTADTDAFTPSIAFAGSSFGLAWSQNDSGTRVVYFAEFDGDGSKLGEPRRVDDGLVDARDPTLCHDGDKFGLVWADARHGDTELYFSAIGD